MCVPEWFLGSFFLSHSESFCKKSRITLEKKIDPSYRLILVIMLWFFFLHNFPSSGSGNTSFSSYMWKQRQASYLGGVQTVSKIHYNKSYQPKKKKKPSHTSANTSVVRRLDLFSVNKRQKWVNTQSRGSNVSTVGTHTFHRLDEMLKNTKHGDIGLASCFF